MSTTDDKKTLIKTAGNGGRFLPASGRLPEAPLVFDVREACYHHQHDHELALDIETGGLNPWKDPVAVVSLYGRQSGVLSVLHVRGDVPKELVETLSRPVMYIGHNVNGFDAPFLAAAGVDVMAPRWKDTLNQELCAIRSNRRDTRVNLETTMRRRTGVQLNKSIDHRTWMQPTLTEEQLEYACGDVRAMFLLDKEQWAAVQGTGQARAMETEAWLAPAVLRMTLNGLPFSERARQIYTSALRVRRDKAEDDLVQTFGPVNLKSSKQLRQAFLDQGTEIANTKHDTFVELSALGGRPGALADVVLEFKKTTQRLNMYSDEWAAKYVTQGLVHPRVWQVGTDTGRMSNSEPNLQQIPKDDARKMFEAPEGYCVVSADYSQIEVWVAAYYARDDAMFEALQSEDTHYAVASLIFNKPVSAITTAERKLAKAATFTLLFGGGANRLYDYARHNGSVITLDQARDIVRLFFARFTGLAVMRKRAFEMANSRRSVSLDLPTGLRRTLVGDDLKGTKILNTLVQGTAAAGLKYALIEAHRRGLTEHIGGTVHDEIVAWCPNRLAPAVAVELKECMLYGMNQVMKGVPIRVGVDVGRTWGGDRLTGASEAEIREYARLRELVGGALTGGGGNYGKSGSFAGRPDKDGSLDKEAVLREAERIWRTRESDEGYGPFPEID